MEDPAVPRRTPEMYIEKYREAAMSDMRISGVPASITLAQGIYESDCGNSMLAIEANNHFGIKCHREWTGPSFHKDDDAPNECFRKYNTVLESYADHSNFLRTRERYSSLFELPVTDYKGWAHGLKRAGYATNPRYAHKLIEIIERYGLHVYDDPSVNAPALATRPQTTVKPATEPTREVTPAQGPVLEARNPHQKKAPRHAAKVSKNRGGDELPIAESDQVQEAKTPRSIFSREKKHDNGGEVPKIKSGAKSGESSAVSADLVNGVPFVKVREGDTWSRIAREQNIELWQVLEFNDAVKNQPLKPGEIVFVSAKKNKSESEFFHVFAPGDSMREISQRYAVKLSKLYRMNELEYGEQPAPGTKIYLQRAMLLGVIL
jgi:LysM repeat protein